MAEFTVTRAIEIHATPERVRSLIEDFRRWTEWSPWEGLDPELKRTYSGAARGLGAAYAWEGNKKAGSGTMEIVGAGDEEVRIDLRFVKPFKQASTSLFQIRPSGHGASVSWTMTGTQRGLAAIFSKVMSMDKLIGKDFEKGLAQLREVAESDS